MLQEINVGYYGTQWLLFMENNHKKIYRQLKREGTLEAVAKSVDDYACDYKKLLDKQYEEMHERPSDIEGEGAFRSWKFTRDFYTDSEVMRERVLKLYTQV